jgi:hypothetical protein
MTDELEAVHEEVFVVRIEFSQCVTIVPCSVDREKLMRGPRGG